MNKILILILAFIVLASNLVFATFCVAKTQEVYISATVRSQLTYYNVEAKPSVTNNINKNNFVRVIDIEQKPFFTITVDY